ncbi:hypothetical protein SLS58_000415 [Diplodia intermedia]|uniref:Cytochrome p450 n=1 Tax=Diplodia intermedia TaxID=856260 RepID=A0ABR3U5J0_9PEZI
MHPTQDNITSYMDDKVHTRVRQALAPGYSGRDAQARHLPYLQACIKETPRSFRPKLVLRFGWELADVKDEEEEAWEKVGAEKKDFRLETKWEDL